MAEVDGCACAKASAGIVRKNAASVSHREGKLTICSSRNSGESALVRGNGQQAETLGVSLQ
jgi:hypothetical protein